MKKKAVKPPPKNSEVHYSGQCTSEILESITDAFYAVDSDWRLTYINYKAEELWQYSRQELLGTILWDMFPEPEKNINWQMHHQAAHERSTVPSCACRLGGCSKVFEGAESVCRSRGDGRVT